MYELLYNNENLRELWQEIGAFAFLDYQYPYNS